jgi:predicted Zn-dependent peptidase
MVDMSEYFKDTLPNGLRLIAVEMPHLHSAEIVCYVGAGSWYENIEEAGISHFLEHVLFRGTTEYPSLLHLERAFEAIGGAVNASTDAEATCYHSRLHPTWIWTGVALFASMLQRPLFLEVEIERKIILEEALEDLNERGELINPDSLTAQLLWPDNPLSLPTIGTRKSIRRINSLHLQKHHATYYTPANTVLVAAGRIRRDEVQAAVEKHFGDWQGPPPPTPPPFLISRKQDTMETAWVRDSDSQVAVQLTFRVPGRRSPHAVPLRVLSLVLSRGGTSRLMLRLREKLGLTYNVEANLSLYDECGCLSVDLFVTPVNLVPAVQEILGIFEELCHEPVGEEELRQVVQGYLYDLDFSQDHPDEMAERYGWGELVGYLRTLKEDRWDIAAASSEALLKTAQELFTPCALKAVVVGPFRAQDRSVVEAILRRFRQD